MPRIDDPPESPWRTHSGRQVYDNPWITVIHYDVTTPGGSPGIYGVVHFRTAACAILPLFEDGTTVLVGQYRYAIRRYSWELPEGGVDPADPLAGARRELQEETGYTARQWHQLPDITLSNSITDETGFIYLAWDLDPGTAKPEETEALVSRRLPMAEVLAMARSGQIHDILTLATLYGAVDAARDDRLPEPLARLVLAGVP